MLLAVDPPRVTCQGGEHEVVGTVRSKYLSIFLSSFVVAGVASVVLLSARQIWRSRAAENTQIDRAAPRASASGLRTSIYKHDSLHLRASAQSIELTRPRLLGPLRIGFLNSVKARDVAVEIYALQADAEGTGNVAEVMSTALQALVPGKLSSRIVGGEIDGLRFTQHFPDGRTETLRAHSCTSDAAKRAVVCTHGFMGDGTIMRRFTEATHDGKQWRMTR